MKKSSVKYTSYFKRRVLIGRPYISLWWCRRAIVNPVKCITQSDGRVRYWIYVPEVERYLRVITLNDGHTLHNAFLDRNFRQEKT